MNGKDMEEVLFSHFFNYSFFFFFFFFFFLDGSYSSSYCLSNWSCRNNKIVIGK